jgi:hypothetical protein
MTGREPDLGGVRIDEHPIVLGRLGTCSLDAHAVPGTVADLSEPVVTAPLGHRAFGAVVGDQRHLCGAAYVNPHLEPIAILVFAPTRGIHRDSVPAPYRIGSGRNPPVSSQ